MHSLDTQHFNYAFMDYRGYGARKGSGGPYTIAQIGHDALALADHLGWQRFSLVGHSMGGLGIQQVLADAPARVQALVGITPVPASGVPFDDAGWAFFSSAARDAAARRSPAPPGRPDPAGLPRSSPQPPSSSSAGSALARMPSMTKAAVASLIASILSEALSGHRVDQRAHHRR